MLVFCSTKKWCQQTANLLAKEVLSDRKRAAARESAAAAAVAAKAAAKTSHSNHGDGALGGGKGAATSAGFATAKSVAQAAAGAAAAAKSTEVYSRAREGTVSSTAKQHDAGAATATTGKEHGPDEGRQTASAEPPSTADAVREKLRQTPVGLDAELSYLVRRVFWWFRRKNLHPFIPSPSVGLWRRWDATTVDIDAHTPLRVFAMPREACCVCAPRLPVWPISSGFS